MKSAKEGAGILQHAYNCAPVEGYEHDLTDANASTSFLQQKTASQKHSFVHRASSILMQSARKQKSLSMISLAHKVSQLSKTLDENDDNVDAFGDAIGSVLKACNQVVE